MTTPSNIADPWEGLEQYRGIANWQSVENELRKELPGLNRQDGLLVAKVWQVGIALGRERGIVEGVKAIAAKHASMSDELERLRQGLTDENALYVEEKAKVKDREAELKDAAVLLREQKAQLEATSKYLVDLQDEVRRLTDIRDHNATLARKRVAWKIWRKLADVAMERLGRIDPR